MEEAMKYCAAQIEEAQREAVLDHISKAGKHDLRAEKCWYCGKPLPCNCACQTNDERRDYCQIEKKAYAEGFRACRDKAKGIAANSESFEGREIAQRIGEMEP